MFKDAKNVNKIKYNIQRRQENYIYCKFLKDHVKRLVLTLLDYYQDQITKIL